MTSLKNNVQLIGRLGNDPIIKTFESGKKMASFSLATNESYHNSEGEKIEETQWHHVIAWGKKTENIEKYLSKGNEVTVNGKLVYRSYEKEGERRYSTEIVLSEMLMHSKAPSS